MKIVFKKDYKWYPNGYQLEGFEKGSTCFIDDEIAKELIKTGIAESAEVKRVGPKKELKVETKKPKKKEKLKPKNKKVDKEQVEEK